jgi:hypothetical protein
MWRDNSDKKVATVCRLAFYYRDERDFGDVLLVAGDLPERQFSHTQKPPPQSLVFESLLFIASRTAPARNSAATEFFAGCPRVATVSVPTTYPLG